MKLFKIKYLAIVALMSLGVVVHAEEAKKAMTKYVELGTGGALDMNDLSTYIYANVSFKGPGDWSITPEFINTLVYKDAGVSKMYFKHDVLRVGFSKSKLSDMSGWDCGMTYRYTAPTSNGDQQAGNIGTMLFRPSLTKKFGALNVVVRNGVSFPLNRSPYQVNVTAPVGNTLVNNTFEVIPSYEISPIMSVDADIFNSNSLKGAPSGTTTRTWSNKIYWEFNFNYTLTDLSDLGLSAGMSNESAYGVTGKSFKLMSKTTTAYTIKVSKAF